MFWRRLSLMFLIIGSVIGLLAYGLNTDPKFVPSPLIGREAPSFILNTFNGGRLSLGDLRGKVVVVNFWASWCYPACWNEAPRLEAAWQQYKNRGVVIVGIVFQDTEDNARKFIRRFDKSYPNGMDPNSRIAIEHGVYGVPETFFIDREGRIAHKHIGEIRMEILTREIEKLL